MSALLAKRMVLGARRERELAAAAHALVLTKRQLNEAELILAAREVAVVRKTVLRDLAALEPLLREWQAGCKSSPAGRLPRVVVSCGTAYG